MCPETQNHAGIMRRQEAAASNFHTTAGKVSGLICNTRADRIGIRLTAEEMQADPMTPFRCIVPEQYRGAIIDADKDIERAVVVDVPDCQAARGEGSGKYGTALPADVFERSPVVMKKQQRLAICNFI